jgi:predicted nuclease of predicted toxin-antitoxin system
LKKVLLDENLPRQLKNLFSNNLDVSTVHDLGWQSKQNGELLSAMSAADITHLITADRNLRFQQNISSFGVKVVVLVANDTRRKSLELRVAEIEREILDWDDSQSDFLEINLRG